MKEKLTAWAAFAAALGVTIGVATGNFPIGIATGLAVSLIAASIDTDRDAMQ